VGGNVELRLCDRRQDAALHADHGAYAAVDDHQQRKLEEISTRALIVFRRHFRTSCPAGLDLNKPTKD